MAINTKLLHPLEGITGYHRINGYTLKKTIKDIIYSSAIIFEENDSARLSSFQHNVLIQVQN